MKKASITEAKNNLSALIDRVKGGSPVLIVDRGRPVARLESAVGDRAGDEAGQLDHLVRAGIGTGRPRTIPQGANGVGASPRTKGVRGSGPSG